MEDERAWVSVWSGDGVADHVKSPIWRPQDSQKYIRGIPAPIGNGPFELLGFPDGTYTVEAEARVLSLVRKVRITNGEVPALSFDFDGESRLSGRVLAGRRALAGIRLEVVPKDHELPRGETQTDSEGRYAVDRLADGDYQVVVKLGARGTHRAFGVTVKGATVFDVPLGPHRLSGKVQSRDGFFVNHIVQARLLDPSDECIAFREFVDKREMYVFDGLEEGIYAISHVSPYYRGVREAAVFGGFVEGVDIKPTFSKTQPARFADAAKGTELLSAQCEVEDGVWAGTIVKLGQGRQLPTTLAGTEMTCSSAGYAPVRVRWDGDALDLELEPDAESTQVPAFRYRNRDPSEPIEHEIFTQADC